MQDKVYGKYGKIKDNWPLDVDEEYELWWLVMGRNHLAEKERLLVPRVRS